MKWPKEIEDSGEDVTPKMMDWIIKELQWNAAGDFQKTGKFFAFDAVAKSDTTISPELQQALKEAVYPLENISEKEKDYHPGSDNKVVDLVHPSLFPVTYGRTRILTDKVIGLDDCLYDVGPTQLLPVPPDNPRPWYHNGYATRDWKFNPYSHKFQWIPCDVEFTADGGCRIVSYIKQSTPQRESPAVRGH